MGNWHCFLIPTASVFCNAPHSMKWRSLLCLTFVPDTPTNKTPKLEFQMSFQHGIPSTCFTSIKHVCVNQTHQMHVMSTSSLPSYTLPKKRLKHSLPKFFLLLYVIFVYGNMKVWMKQWIFCWTWFNDFWGDILKNPFKVSKTIYNNKMQCIIIRMK